ncbi:TrbC/VirB2 family protein [Enterobacter asburiae]|uniref:TrbC/VirB2 family protein n=1 Tax=Enterobacter asburiae TaxID=61645 RepID=UPI0021CEE74A|nr:TrbC/VirB2 family protein [Enterobacter asburiae]MCU6244004.1 TrbC/VirB2 family protein [Enterobacter asburiae]
MNKFRLFRSRLSLLALMLFIPALAQASSSSGMPWEGPLMKVVDSITGPVAFGISVLAIAVAGLSLAFGGQLDGFVHKLAIIALVVSLIVFAVNVLSAVFGVSSTLVACSALSSLAVA